MRHPRSRFAWSFVALMISCGDPEIVADRDGDGYDDADDCAPDIAEIHPGAWEVCDGEDNDCDGEVDELYDLDGDGWLADDAGCRALGEDVDCNDLDPTIHPDADEQDNSVDDDCDGIIDDSPDADGDGYEAFDDCDDSDPFINPGAADACDGLDNDCDGVVDEDFDRDGDGVAPCMGDCDDADPYDSPALSEICDGVDNNCDGDIDEGFDADGDGFRVCDGDCNDANPDVAPGMLEICDGGDDDCDPSTDEDADLDGDGATLCDGDCNDASAAAHPGGTETCDGVDNDCNGGVDDLDTCWDCTALTSGYALCETLLTWGDAEAACETMGGTLAVFADADENAAASSDAWAITSDQAWIALSDAAVEGDWVWPDGSSPSFTAWGSGEPNDYGGEDCAATNFSALAAWNDNNCGVSAYFLCSL